MALDPINVKYWNLIHGFPYTNSQNDIAVRCDICGDGNKRKSKRLHLYTKPSFDGDVVHCWNCGYSSNMYNYIKEHHTSFLNQYALERRGESFNELLSIKEKANSTELKMVDLNFNEGKTVTPTEPRPKLVQPLMLDNLDKHPNAKEYIINRGITPQKTWLYCKGKINFDNKDLYLKDYIIIPLLWSNGLWYGFQALAWKTKDFRVVLLEDNSGWKIENWININKDKNTYIMESIYDRLSSGKENSLAQMGASISKDRLKELKNPVFCLDNQNFDEAARRETLNYAEKGYKVFIWPKGSENFKDFNDLRKVNVPFEKISSMIDNNVFEGMEAVLKIKML